MPIPSDAQATETARVAFIDGLRALAVVAVMVYHLEPAWLPGGFVGVDVFFVISGFVVTASLAGHRHETLGAFLGGFYARRLARLMPALLLALLVSTLAYVLLVPPAWFNRAAEGTALSAFWGLGNWTLDRHAVNYFEPRAELNPFTHTWSLGVEEQFYLLAPMLLFAALRRDANCRAKYAALAIVAALSAASLAACIGLGWAKGSRFVFFQVAFRFWELGCGVLLFLAQHEVRRALGRVDASGIASALGGLALVAVALFAPRTGAYPYVRALVAVVGTALLIGPAPQQPADAVRRRFATSPMVWIGERSYALYLWHWPLYVIARWTVGLTVWPMAVLAPALALALAVTSYRWVEHPIRHHPGLRALGVPVRLALFLAGIGVAWAVAVVLFDRQPQLGVGVVTRQAEDWYANRQLLRRELAGERLCDPAVEPVAIGGATRAGTTFDPSHCATTERRVLVLGDSHATAYLPLMEQLSASLGVRVTVLPTPGCSYLNLLDALDARRDPACHRVAEQALRALLAEARAGDTAFLPALRVPRLVELGGFRRASIAGGDLYDRTPLEQAGVARATADAPRWLQPLFDAGLRVVIEAPKPVFRLHPFACAEWWNRSNPECRAGFSEQRSDQERLRSPTMAALHMLAARYPGLEVWDPMPLLCDDSTCSAMRGGRPLFFDGDHLSPFGNLTLLPALQAVLKP